MADIIPFEDRLRKQKEETLSKEKKKRLDSFRMAMQCTACHFKCAKCGSQLEVPETQFISAGLAVKTLPGLLGRISDLSTLDHRLISERGAGILP